MLIFQPQGVNNVPISSGRSTDVSSLRGRRKTKRLFNTWQRGILHALLPSSYCCNVVCSTNVNLGQEKFFSAFWIVGAATRDLPAAAAPTAGR